MDPPTPPLELENEPNFGLTEPNRRFGSVRFGTLEEPNLLTYFCFFLPYLIELLGYFCALSGSKVTDGRSNITLQVQESGILLEIAAPVYFVVHFRRYEGKNKSQSGTFEFFCTKIGSV